MTPFVDYYNPFHEPHRTAMINKKEVEYDLCSEKRSAAINPSLFEYIGRGKIYKINGVYQSRDKREMYFWRKKNSPSGSDQRE